MRATMLRVALAAVSLAFLAAPHASAMSASLGDPVCAQACVKVSIDPGPACSPACAGIALDPGPACSPMCTVLALDLGSGCQPQCAVLGADPGSGCRPQCGSAESELIAHGAYLCVDSLQPDDVEVGISEDECKLYPQQSDYDCFYISTKGPAYSFDVPSCLLFE